MIGSKHQKRVVTHLTKILKSLGTSQKSGKLMARVSGVLKGGGRGREEVTLYSPPIPMGRPGTWATWSKYMIKVI